MHTLVFATNNANKVAEIKKILPSNFNIIPLKEAGIHIDIPEPHDTLEKNAAEKAEVIHRLTGKDCFSEDTGLEVPLLGNAPGVRSARYAGEPANNHRNIEKLLQDLNGRPAPARFRTVVCLKYAGNTHFFEGICAGTIITEKRGEQGFGYDPVFIPDGADRTFAEMNTEEKNNFSHRKKAIAQMAAFLSRHEKNSPHTAG